MKAAVKVIAVSVVVLIVVGLVIAFRPRWRPVPTNTAIAGLKIDGKRVRVRLTDNSRLDEVIRLFPFHGRRPLCGFDKARAVFGNPDNVRTRGDYFTAYEYWYRDGRVDLEFEDTATGQAWSLCAYPGSMYYQDVLTREIADVVDPAAEETIVVVQGRKDDLVMLATIKGLRVESISWLFREGMDRDLLRSQGARSDGASETGRTGGTD